MSNKYTVVTRLNGRRICARKIPYPFARHTVHISLWDTLKGLLRGLTVEVTVSADRDTEEAVLELNPDYRGLPGSERRKQCDAEMNEALGRFADSLPRDQNRNKLAKMSMEPARIFAARARETGTAARHNFTKQTLMRNPRTQST